MEPREHGCEGLRPYSNKWASMRENLSSRGCEKQMRRPACAFVQSDQRFFTRLLESSVSKRTTNKILII